VTTSPAIPSSSAAKAPAARVRVKLQRVSYSKPCPPDGHNELWWNRLKTVLGTSSSDFVDATLVQTQNAARLSCGGICEMSGNAVLAFIEAAEPKNEIEAALAIQMASTHAVAMVVAGPAAPTVATGTLRAWLRRVRGCSMPSPTRSRRCAAFATAVPKSFGLNGSKSPILRKLSLATSVRGI